VQEIPGSEEKPKEKSKEELLEKIQVKLSENYYLEDDKKLLDILIKNCHPIISDLLQQVENFNSYNQVYMVEEKKQSRHRYEITDIVTEADQNLRELVQNKQ